MVTDEQVRRLRKLSNTEKNQEIASSKAGMDPTTARRYLGLERLPSELKRERHWRTREDPFGEVWDAVQRQVQESPRLEAKTLFEWLQREYPGQFNDGQIRTLQRRIKLWRATEGPAQEVYFGQKHVPGRLCASDFTHMTQLGITLKGQTFEHLVYHFVLTYSNWETGTVCYSESLESLSEGWQNAVWELGAVPVEHRTDSLSSAVNNMSNLEEFNRRYEGVMRYYGVKPRHTNPASPNENGDAEQSHHRFKRAVEQTLLLRGRSKHRVDYRHIIEWLVRKPGAFENYRYQEDLFPTSRFRMAYDALKETAPSRSSKEYLKILKLAAEEGEVQVDEALRELLEGEAEAVITEESIRALLARLDTIPPVTMVEVASVDLTSFDQLCLDMEVQA